MFGDHRKQHPLPIALALVAALAAAAAGGEYAKATASVSPAEVPAGAAFDLKVSLQIDPGIHVYRDSISFAWDELRNAKLVEVLKPKGKDFRDLTSDKADATAAAYEGTVEIVARFQATGAAGERAAVKGKMAYQGCNDTVCFFPQRAEVAGEVPIVPGKPATATPTAPDVRSLALQGEGAPRSDARVTPEGVDSKQGPAAGGFTALDQAQKASGEEGGWLAFLLRLLGAFGAGIAISFTPCVYPMIPITVAIIGGHKERSRARTVALAATYVLGIALTYAAVGLIVAAVGAAAQSFLQSAYVRVPLAALFVVLALSMFDVVTIQMPGAASGLTDRLSGRLSGVVGVFLLGIVSGVIVGPCVTAPLVGILGYIAQTGDRWLGFWMLFTLAWGMGLVLVVAGVSTAILPKAGPWMAWIKHLLGFILLWAALYFLAPIIGETAYLLLTAGVLLAGAVFLGGLDALTPESGPGERAKRFLGLAAIVAAALLAFAGSARVLGLAAPRQESPVFVEGDEAAVDAALKSGKPVMLDFWATWCENCKEMDRTTFVHPQVVGELRRFRAIKVDIDRNAALVRRYGLKGAPTYVFFDSSGKELEKLRTVGYTEADRMLKTLSQVR